MSDQYIPNDNVIDGHSHPHPKGFGLPQQVKHLKSFVAYFRFQDGDVPVNIVATNIKDAAKLASMPGIMGPDAAEPVDIKADGKIVGVAMPVNTISFDTVVIPAEAAQAGAYATPEHYIVRNGENVIFEAKVPFGYTFDGWYKTGRDGRLSAERVAEIDVYDDYATRIRYEARFIHSPSLRSGRYLDLTRGNILTFEFNGNESAPFGKAIWDGGSVSSYHTIISALDQTDPENIQVSFIKDPTVTQPGNMGLTGVLTYSPVGINIEVSTVSLDNPYGYLTGSVLTLQFLGNL
jgi:hypothetical protein